MTNSLEFLDFSMKHLLVLCLLVFLSLDLLFKVEVYIFWQGDICFFISTLDVLS